MARSSGASADQIRSDFSGFFDYPTCVRYALVHSENFLKSRLDVQLHSIDLKDAHAELLPTIQVLTRYYIARATPPESKSFGRLSVSLFMTNWDPYLALLKMKSYGILVDIGKLNHQDLIAENVGRMAKLFYGIHLLEKSIRARKQMMALQQNKLDYSKSRASQGAIDSIDLRAMANAIKGEQIKIRSLEQDLQEKITSLKMLMGYHPDYYLPLDTRDAANQILNGFNGNLVTFASIQAQNLSLQISAKQEQLQSNRVTGAYVALVPKPLLIFEQVENQVDRTSGFNFALGLDYLIWDGFKRVRDIKRQKMKAEQLKIDRSLLSQKLYSTFKTLRSVLDAAGEREAFYREQAKLAEMLEEKAFLMYKSGNIMYDEYIARRMDRVEAEINAINSIQARIDALIELATISGGLNKYNAAIRF